MKPMPNRFPLVMKSTALVTAAVTAVLAAAYQFCPQDFLLSATISFGTTCYHFAMRLLVGSSVPRLTKSIRYEHWWFRQQPFESRFYAIIGVKNWKGKLPTYDPRQFSLKENTLAQVVYNTCNAELVHEVIIVFSFLPLLFSSLFGAFPVFLITSVIAALYDSIFVIAQRYNRPRLVRILEKKGARQP